jgi:hypothetical protein
MIMQIFDAQADFSEIKSCYWFWKLPVFRKKIK